MRLATLLAGGDYKGRQVEDADTLEQMENTEGELDDASLVQAARLRPEAFGTLYRRYLTRIYHYMRLRSDNDEDAADLTQQVFLRALDALPKYTERGVPVSAWLFRIARNLATDSHRQQRSSVAWDQLSVEQLRGPENPETEILQSEASTQLRAMLATLPTDKRELLALRFAGGLTAKEIGQVVGKAKQPYISRSTAP